MSKYTENFPNLSTYDFETIMCQLKQVCGADPSGLINAQFLSRPTTAKDIALLLHITYQLFQSQVELQKQFVELYTFVKDFFENLDLQEEVNEWLDNALETGKLALLLQGIVYSPINVKASGIVPDTENDITQALQTLLDSHENGTFYFPNGNYKVNGTIMLNSNVTFILEKNAIIMSDANNLFSFECIDHSFHLKGGKLQKGTVSDFNSRTLTGNVFDSGLFHFTNCIGVSIESVELLVNTTGNTFTFLDCENVEIKNSVFSQFLYGAIMFYDGCKNVKVENCSFSKGKRSTSQQYNYPIASGFSTYSSPVDMIENYVVNNCVFKDCDWEGCDCHGGKNIRFSNLKMYNCNRFVTIYADNRPQLNDYNFSDAIIENCYFENANDYQPPTPDASIYCNGRYNRYFTNLTLKNIVLINPSCYDSEENTNYGAIFTNYNRNVNIENVHIEGGRNYSVPPYVMYTLCTRNLKIKNMEIINMPALTQDAPIRLQYVTGDIDDLTVINNGLTYAGVYVSRPSAVKLGRNIHGNLSRMFYTQRDVQLLGVGEIVPYSFPSMSPSNMFISETNRGYVLTTSASDPQVSKNVTIVSGNNEINLGEEYFIAPVGTSVLLKSGDNELDTIITDFRENYFTVADTPNFSGSGTVTINRGLRTTITNPHD